ncbi:MAG: hypothetical protein ABFC84_18360 [Veillonellales bacterium]
MTARFWPSALARYLLCDNCKYDRHMMTGSMVFGCRSCYAGIRVQGMYGRPAL